MKIRYSQLIHQYPSPSAEPRKVLDISDWTIDEGEQLLIRGISGSGKTTLFNITAGLMQPTSGMVWFDNTNLYDLAEAKRDQFRAQHIGYVFQTHYLMNTLTAIDNVIMPLAFAKTQPKSAWRSIAQPLLERVGLGDHLNYLPAKLSTGQRMRVAVARALVSKPSLILADEPTASLDETSATSVMDLLQDICNETNATLLVNSHDPSIYDRFTSIVNLSHGKLAFEGTVAT